MDFLRLDKVPNEIQRIYHGSCAKWLLAVLTARRKAAGREFRQTKRNQPSACHSLVAEPESRQAWIRISEKPLFIYGFAISFACFSARHVVRYTRKIGVLGRDGRRLNGYADRWNGRRRMDESRNAKASCTCADEKSPKK